jgi:hypothetical protein
MLLRRHTVQPQTGRGLTVHLLTLWCHSGPATYFYGATLCNRRLDGASLGAR